MKQHSDLLFVYGTLQESGNEFASYLNSNSIFLKKGKIKGLLYDIGNYPGAITDPTCDNYVYGSIFKMHNPEALLTVLDDYEGVGLKHPKPNEYRRELITIDAGDEQLNCWVYLYNREVEGLNLINSGDYMKHIGR